MDVKRELAKIKKAVPGTDSDAEFQAAIERLPHGGSPMIMVAAFLQDLRDGEPPLSVEGRAPDPETLERVEEVLDSREWRELLELDHPTAASFAEGERLWLAWRGQASGG